jgi:hypothetical protein
MSKRSAISSPQMAIVFLGFVFLKAPSVVASIERAAVAGTCTECIHAALSAADQSNPLPASDRIQLGEWTDPVTKTTLPLTQIVKIRGVTPDGMSSHGTGFLLDECRIMTAVHVLAGIRTGNNRSRGLNYIGQKFGFESKPLQDGKRKMGQFIVLAHGSNEGGQISGALHDWAIGYDPECNYRQLGFISLSTGQTFEAMKRRTFFAAGYSWLPSLVGSDEANRLYVDRECGVVEDVGRHNTGRNNVLTDCSATHGGSGEPLLAPVRERNGRIVVEEGRPLLIAYAIYKVEGPKLDNLDVPNVGATQSFVIFSYDFLKQISPHLKGKPALP